MESSSPKLEIVWFNVLGLALLHALSAMAMLQCSMTVLVWQIVILIISDLGITAGVHRLWCHRSYKARLPLRIFLGCCSTVAGQNSIFAWCRDHRVHHKFSETDADPHNIKRGFFFAHIGWLLCRKHPAVRSQGSKIDLSDLTSDPWLMFQHRHYIPLVVIFCYVLPTIIPILLWREPLFTSLTFNIFRYVFQLHCAFLVNSAAHSFGDRPYDSFMTNATENRLVSALAMGEGFHNYHHVFPQDYSTSEWRYSLNLTTLFIDLCCLVGLAYDRKSIPLEVVRERMRRTGVSSSSKRLDGIEEMKQY